MEASMSRTCMPKSTLQRGSIYLRRDKQHTVPAEQQRDMRVYNVRGVEAVGGTWQALTSSNLSMDTWRSGNVTVWLWFTWPGKSP